MNFLALLALFLFGIVDGVILHIAITNIRADGTFKIDTSNPEKDVYSLELSIPIDQIEKKKSLVFTIKKNA